MPKTADQADATTREILGPQFTAMRNLVEAAENSRQKADAVAKAQAEHVESTAEFIAAYDAAKAAGFTTAQLKKGGYVRPSLKGAAKPATTKKEPAPSPSTAPAANPTGTRADSRTTTGRHPSTTRTTTTTSSANTTPWRADVESRRQPEGAVR